MHARMERAWIRGAAGFWHALCMASPVICNSGDPRMARGSKDAYTDKQKRQAAHIEQSEQEAGRSQEDAERIAWATVNKQDGGGKKATKDKRGDSKRTS
jgi:hypothetical protein